MIASEGGVLATTLDAKVSQVEVGGKQVSTLVYNGQFPGPTLRVKAGDDLKVKLVNGSDGGTNLHTHGWHVSPVGFGDNVLHHLDPGATWDIDIATPDDLAPGLYWYHAHQHGDTEPQVTGGLAGALIVEGALDELPGINGDPGTRADDPGQPVRRVGQMVPVANQTTTLGHPVRERPAQPGHPHAPR